MMELYTNINDLFLQIEYGLVDKQSNSRRSLSILELKQEFNANMVNLTEHGYNLLEISALSGRLDFVEYLLTFSGWNINHQNHNGETILQFISDKSIFSFDIAMTLLNYGNVDTTIVDSWGNNPIWTTLYNMYYQRIDDDLKQKYSEWLRALVDFGFEFNDRSRDVFYEKNSV